MFTCDNLACVTRAIVLDEAGEAGSATTSPFGEELSVDALDCPACAISDPMFWHYGATRVTRPSSNPVNLFQASPSKRLLLSNRKGAAHRGPFDRFLRGHEASHCGGVELPEAVNALRRPLVAGRRRENLEDRSQTSSGERIAVIAAPLDFRE
jgi:hypothetical protein